MRDWPLHSLAYTNVSDFTTFAIEEAARDDNSPTSEWDRTRRLDAMLQCLCVRRCLFAPIHETLLDSCNPLMLESTIKEHREDTSETVYQDGIQKLLKDRFQELATNAGFQPYFKSTEVTRPLQVHNMHNLFHHCEDFADTNKVEFVASATRSTEARCAYLVPQFSFVTTILRDYFTRDLYRQKFQEVLHDYMTRQTFKVEMRCPG